MKAQSALRVCSAWVVIAMLASWAGTAHAQKNVVQPGDPIIASSANMPASEGVANAIDGTQAKYLNFDSKQSGGVIAAPSGFVVTPSVGVTWVTGIAIQSANDAPERDAKSITLEGSNDDTITNFTGGTWELIYKNDAIPAWTARYQTQTFSFTNLKPYKHYRWTVLAVQADNTCCMQVAEVQLLGSTLPKNVAQPGDKIFASSANMPASEGVANAIDGTQAKYLNFDSKQAGGVIAAPSGFALTPAVGATVVNGIAMQSANDAPERDPKSITLEGSNDDTISGFSGGTWELIYKNEAVPAYTARYQTQTFLFDNFKPFKHYRWTVLLVQADNTCCMQIAEVQLLGAGAPKNILQPGDPIVASSANMPASEGVANAIDGTQAKYLNFDSKQSGGVIAAPSGFAVTPSVGATTITGMFIESANDAPERDPLSVTVEGSNDDTVTSFSGGTWELIYKNEAVPAFSARYQTQTFYFQNSKSYKHYRWTVLKVQADNTCCMQVAEVGLLAVTSQTDCSKVAFLLQPENTPVLSGSQATFFTTVNGPWPLQWYVDGAAIPGATAPSYTTEAITAQNASKIYTVAIVGCQTSTPVHTVLFTPSSTKSIGMQFGGGGANGAGPQGGSKYLLPTDIVGVQPQAYWNVVTNDAGAASGYTGDQATMTDALVDSDNKPTTITFEYATTGRWGAGVGTDTPVQKMLNGTAGSGGVTTTDQTVTFHNVPAGKHSVLVYAVSPPKQIQTISYKIGSTTYYVRVMNSDEYKPAPGFYRGTSTDSKNPSIANFVRFDNVSPDAAGDVQLVFNVIVGSDRESGVNAIQLVLNAPSVGAPPTIATDPQPTVGPEKGTVTLSVQASGDNLTYQWRKNGRNLPNGGHVSGATTSKLTISSLSATDEAVYNVAVFNAAGSTVSKNATVTVSKYNIQDALAGYWKFNETSGTTAANVVSGGKSANVNGTAAWATGKVNGALSFDGGSTYAVVDNYPKGTKAVSASAWVKLDATAISPMAIVRNGEGSLRAPGDNSSVPAGQFELVVNQDATDNSFRLNAQIQAGPSFPSVTAPTAFPMGQWTHVAFTADGAQLRLYINGKEVSSIDYANDLKTSTVDFLSIGARLNTNDTAQVIVDDTPNYLMGQVDELAVWTRALTADEVSKLYAAGQAGQDLTTVKEEAPVVVTEPGTMTISQAAGKVTITWDKGTLQTATAVNGQWTDSTQTSPLTVTPEVGKATFYRTTSE